MVGTGRVPAVLEVLEKEARRCASLIAELPHAINPVLTCVNYFQFDTITKSESTEKHIRSAYLLTPSLLIQLQVGSFLLIFRNHHLSPRLHQDWSLGMKSFWTSSKSLTLRTARTVWPDNSSKIMLEALSCQ